MRGFRRVTRRWMHVQDQEIVILDNRDSFVFNLAHRMHEVGADRIVVVRSDEIALEELVSWRPRALILSPGPGHPKDAGVCVEIVRHCVMSGTPLLGVCLGHQAIAYALGARVLAHGCPKHGVATILCHDGRGLYDGCAQDVEVGRYHALSVDSSTLPSDLVETSWSEGVLMGVRHLNAPVYGVQFHPESVLTPCGMRLLQNFMTIVQASTW